MVMKMKGSKDILSSILKTTQMGQIGIRSILNEPLQPSLRTELRNELREYDAIEQEVHGIAKERGWELKELNPAIKSMANMMTRTQLSYGELDSKAAAMMIRGNTRGIIKGYKNLNQFPPSDRQVNALAQRLIDIEEANNHLLQGFL
ncbi:MAG: hypothetical protein IJX01_06355 [Oscillospiraceae bacterium]|nr:hypothetical protein [Oscillospiraceae bacterium]